ncbi:MAG: hypothetical protein ABI769_04790 [Pseudomonadota bacterium]
MPESRKQSKLVPALAWTAAAAFAASWFLPVLADVPGWMAFRYALAPLVPYGDASTRTWDDSVPQVMSALTNVVFVILFALWAFRLSPRPGMFVRIALICFVLNLYWFVSAWRDHSVGDLLIGYYVWQVAFALLLTVAVLIAFASRQTSKIPTAGTPS